MPRQQPLLTRVLADPQRLPRLRLGQWDLLIRQARRSDLLGRVGMLVAEGGYGDRLPSQAVWHLESALAVAHKQQNIVRWEARQIHQALRGVDAPLVMLKGAAYVLAELPPAEGRMFHDIDVMVPRQSLEESEQALRAAGWAATHLDPYDQHYYRTWMHELPPLRHVARKTVLDVHHTILPPTARLHPDPDKLFAAAVPIEGWDGLLRLEDCDLVLHSATHLFNDGELDRGLRDLVDLDALLRHFGSQKKFWERLLDRAWELDLQRPLYYALRYTRALLGTPISPQVEARSRPARPRVAGRWLMDRLFTRALAPDHPTCDRPLSGTARWLLYVRSHYLRMPLRLLIPHLVRKAMRREEAVE